MVQNLICRRTNYRDDYADTIMNELNDMGIDTGNEPAYLQWLFEPSEGLQKQMVDSTIEIIQKSLKINPLFAFNRFIEEYNQM